MSIKYSQVKRSRLPTLIAPPYNLNAPEFLERNLRKKKKSHEAFISDYGRPCYLIELGFEIFSNPGQYKNIFEY